MTTSAIVSLSILFFSIIIAETRGSTCFSAEDCHVNATCLRNATICKCNDGYFGNGSYCEVYRPITELNFTNITSHSCYVNFNQLEGLTELQILVKLRHTQQETRILIASGPRTITHLSASTVYLIKVAYRDALSDTVEETPWSEVKTMPEAPELRIGTPTSSSVAILMNIPHQISATSWIVQYKKDSDNTTRENTTLGNDPGIILRGLHADTQYQVRARIRSLGNRILNESETEYCQWRHFKTDKLSVFGRVMYKLHNTSSKINKTQIENHLIDEYQNCGYDANVIAIEDNDPSIPLVHYKIKVSRKSEIDCEIGFPFQNLSINEGDKVDSGIPLLNIADNKITMDYASSCSQFVRKFLLVTPDYSNTRELNLEGTAPNHEDVVALNDTALLNLRKDSVVALQPRYLAKDCEKNTTDSFFYNEYFEDSQGSNGFFYWTETTLTNEGDIEYDSLTDRITIPAVPRAIKYEIKKLEKFIDRTGPFHNIIRRDETQIDASKHVKMELSKLELQDVFSFILETTVRNQDIKGCEATQSVGRYLCAYIEKDLNLKEFLCEDIGGCQYLTASESAPYDCSCVPGYTSGGTFCTDIDECKTRNQHDCHRDATCINYNGGYTCHCKDGFTGNGTHCEDIDECKGMWVSETDFEICWDRMGKRRNTIQIDCSPKDVEKFPTTPCALNGGCTNLTDDFACKCQEGYTGDGKRICGRAEDVRLSLRNREKERNQGFVEIRALEKYTPWINNTLWGSICDDNWSKNESDAVCVHLGYKEASLLTSKVSERHLPMKAWIDHFRCDNVTSIHQCSTGVFGSANCSNRTYASLVCSNTTVSNDVGEMLYETWNGSVYTFRCKYWEIKRMVKSYETCERDGRAAAIECVGNKTNGKLEIDFDYTTFEEFICNATTSKLMIDARKEIDDQYGIAKVLGDLSAISENMTREFQNAPGNDHFDIPRIFVELANNLKKTKPEKPSAFYLVWCLDNFDHLLQLMVKDNTNLTADKFSEENKLKYVLAVRKILSALSLKERNITVDTKHTTYKAVQCQQGISKDVEGVRKGGRHTPKANITVNDTSGGGDFYANVLFNDNSTTYPKPVQPDPESGRPEPYIKEVIALSFAGDENLGNSWNVTANVELELPFDYNEEPKTASGKGTLFFHCCSRLLSNGSWISNGTETHLVNDTFTSCSTKFESGVVAFSVLVSAYPVENSVALGIAGFIGCALSSFSLVLVTIIYLSIRKIRSEKLNQIHIHLSVCLLTFYVTFLAGVHRDKAYIPCLIVAGTLQFSLLSAWGWMFIESFTMLRKFMFPFNKLGDHYILKCAIVTYLICGVAVPINAFFTTKNDEERWGNCWKLAFASDVSFRPSEYVGDIFCWLHRESLYFGFLTPVGTVIFFNMIFATAIIWKITKGSKVRSNSKTEYRQHFFRSVTVIVLLGIPWAVGIPLSLTHEKVVQDLFGTVFTLLNAYQGVFIFLALCVMRNDVRSQWTSELSKIVKTENIDSSVVTMHRSTAVTSAPSESKSPEPIMKPIIYQPTIISSYLDTPNPENRIDHESNLLAPANSLDQSYPEGNTIPDGFDDVVTELADQLGLKLEND